MVKVPHLILGGAVVTGLLVMFLSQASASDYVSLLLVVGGIELLHLLLLDQYRRRNPLHRPWLPSLLALLPALAFIEMLQRVIRNMISILSGG